MIELASGWALDVDRGPDWIFISIRGSDQPSGFLPLAENAWKAMEQHFVNRVVVELHDAPFLYSQVLGELVRLQKRVTSSGGLLRLCGLSDDAFESLQVTQLHGILPCFHDRGDAVMGRPRQPR